MSPRRARRRADDPRPLLTSAFTRIEEHPDGEWMVRHVSAGRATKVYRCPGCDHEVLPGTPHVVAWRPDDESGRRHWHSPCWTARLRRRPR
jgi:hypothetical protein